MLCVGCRPGSQQQRLPNTFPPGRHTRQAQEQLRQQNPKDSGRYQPQATRGSQSAGDSLCYLQALRPASSPGAQGRMGSVSLQRHSQCSAMHSSNEGRHRSSMQMPGPIPYAPIRHDRLPDVPRGSRTSAQPFSHDSRQQGRQESHHQSRDSIIRLGKDGHSASIAGKKLFKEVGILRKHSQTSSAQLRQALQQGQAGTVGGGLKRRPKPTSPGKPFASV